MMQSEKKLKNIFLCIIALVLSLHLGLLTLKIYENLSSPKSISKTQKDKALKIKVIDDVFRNQKQIVQSEDGKIEKPKESRFLSDKDRSFERETRAARVGTFQKAAKGNANVTFEGSEEKKAKSKGRQDLKLSDLGGSSGTEDPFKEAAKKYSQSKRGINSGDPNSRGISSTNDYVVDVPLGDLTHLNTVEFKYYGFYHRIRQKLEQFWGRSLQEKAQLLGKDGRRIASDDHITSLQITLDEMGEIIAIKVQGSSGIKELDDAAIESFNDAGPFPNPPKDLVVNGKVTLSWGFVVST